MCTGAMSKLGIRREKDEKQWQSPGWLQGFTGLWTGLYKQQTVGTPPQKTSTMQDYNTVLLLETPPTALHVPHGAVTLSSRARAIIVVLLSWLFAWCPTLAMALGKVVTWAWPNFRRT